MKKKQKQAIGIILIAIVSLFVLYNQGVFNKPLALSGYTSLSISNVQIVDGGSKIRIYGVTNGAEQISIQFTPIEINNYISGSGYTATNTVTGSITLTKQNKLFQLQKNTNENFIKLYNQDIGRLTLCSDSDCNNNKPSSNYFLVGKFRSPTLVCVCLFGNSAGTNSVFTGLATEDSIVDINIGGATGQLRPSQGSNVVTLNDGKTSIEWVGSLNNYQTITPPSYSVLFTGSQFSKLISSNAYSNYRNSISQFDSCIGASGSFFSALTGGIFNTLFNLPSVDTISNCVLSHNNRVESYLADMTQVYANSINSDGVSFDSNNLIVDLKTPSQFPTFIITLDAQSVGIIELKGKPQIVACVPGTTINSGDTYPTSISVKNVGSNDGSFYGTVSCNGNVYGSITETYVSQGETKSIPVTISGSNTNSGTQYSSCKFTIIDRKSQQSAECSSTIGVTYQQNIICSPSSKICISSKILRTCDSQGTSFSDVTCPDSCIQTGDTGSCEGNPPPPPSNKCESCDSYVISKTLGWIWKEKQCDATLTQSLTGCFTSWIKFILAFLVLIFGTLFSRDFLDSFKQLRKSGYGNLISWILALGIGILLAVLIFQLFWLGVVLGIILLVIRIVIGGKIKRVRGVIKKLKR